MRTGSQPTPLSDLITEILEQPSAERLSAFHAAYLQATVGVKVVDLPPGVHGKVQADGSLSMAHCIAPDARHVVGTCADPAVFVQRYDPGYNASMRGADVLEMLLELPEELVGVLVASAASEHSIVIDRSDVPRILGGPRTERRWWRIWS